MLPRHSPGTSWERCLERSCSAPPCRYLLPSTFRRAVRMHDAIRHDYLENTGRAGDADADDVLCGKQRRNLTRPAIWILDAVNHDLDVAKRFFLAQTIEQ